ncbi:ER membrane protein complex subunit 1-like [Stegodyphus dumicola]|uniref:ER membrane protein complex subunit 1-like n=1 Tax=Stegodyphus dumicola TaxID=202533 RepID=UPI0015AB6187|nr:ER membrane protein complex subunit 1-like [Stegodyphus dumicola]
MRWTKVFALLKILICFTYFEIVNCLYEDQVGKFDWRQQYIGKIKFAYIDPAVSGTHKFIVSTEENVLACLSTRTGSIIWRQVLEKGKVGKINAMSEEGDLITVSGGGQFIRSWDSTTGVLEWETSFPNLQKNDAQLYFHIDSQAKDIIKVEIIPKQYFKVSVYSYTRASLKTLDVDRPSWLDENSKCRFSSSVFFLCVDSKNKLMYLVPVKDHKFIPDIPLDGIYMMAKGSDNAIIRNVNIVSVPSKLSYVNNIIAMQLENRLLILQTLPATLKVDKIFNNVCKVKMMMIDDNFLLFSMCLMDNIYSIKAFDADSNAELQHLDGSFSLSEDRGDLETFFILPYIKKDHGISYKVLLLFEDHSVLVIHQHGRMVWSREEALSNILSSEIIDLPLSETDANIEQEFGHPDAGLISMFLTRLKSQVYLLQTFLIHALTGFKSDSDSGIGDKKALMRDTFGLHKIIIVLTKPGKAFGIDNLSGLIIWSHYENGFSPFVTNYKQYLPLFVQRTTAHYPYPPICTAVGIDSKSKKSHIYSFNPISGTTLESKSLPYHVIQVMSGGLSFYLREILLLDTNMTVHIYPESHDISKHKNTHFIFTAEPSAGSLVGYKLINGENNSLRAVEVWNIKLPQAIIEIVSKKPQEHVHSQGRVMGDRSVLYKYLNPNLAAVFTEGSDSVQKTFCNIYLIDIITGLIVYSASHKRCKSPIHVVHSENWIVYSYYNDKSRRIEISSIELFEGMYQSNTTAFSSFAPPPLPLVEHQTFIFPSVIETMADTVTERGMTSKHLLIALPSGGILELPKTFLDPRRPINPLPEHREEGLIPYIPELPIMSEGIVNYNQSIMRVQGIVTAPSGLESTCLVFVHGLDLFYTRVTPSKTFDILKDDFDHYLISVVLLILLVLSYTTKKLAARKTLRAAWK